MKPDYKNAAVKASDFLARFGSETSAADLLRILKQFPNVSAFPFSLSPVDDSEYWEASTFVRSKNGTLQYIVMYNNSLPSFLLRRTLARELGHVVLEHDGTAPEDVWMEEANCFAYHLLSGCTAFRVITIFYRPHHQSISYSFKSMQTFDSIDALKRSIAEEHTRISRFIGKDTVFTPDDVEIRNLNEKDIFGGWKNYSSVVLAGRPVGYCGE